MRRNLDGVYFRVKENDKWEDVCFSDLTEEKQDEIMNDKSIEWCKRLCKILAKTIKDIGDTFDLVVE